MEEYEPGSIRTYLMQMGDIPLLTRREELATAQRIERTRRVLRRAILESDYVLRSALSILDGVLTGRMRLEQAVDIALTDPAMAGGLLRRIEANRRTLEQLLGRNRHDFRAAMNRRRPAACRQQARRRLALRRRRAARLVDEIGLRMQRLQPGYQGLCEMGKQMAVLAEHLPQANHRAVRHARSRQTRRRWTNCDGDLRRLKRMTLDTPRGLHAPPGANRPIEQTARSGPPRPGFRQPPAGRFHRQTLPQPRPELPGSDPGRQHGADAGGGQVRVRPRLPFLDLRDLVDSPGDQPRHRRSEPHDPRARPHDREDGQGPRHQSRPGAYRRPRADLGRSGRAQRAVDRRHPAGLEDEPAAAFLGPAGRPPGRELPWRPALRSSRKRSRWPA